MASRLALVTAATASSIALIAVLANHWYFKRRKRQSCRRRLHFPNSQPADGPPRSLRVAGKFFIVTGAQGCGEAVAKALAIEGAAGLTICDIDKNKGAAVQATIEAEPYRCSAVFVCCDLSVASECSRCVAAHDAAFHRIDGLVNCAASNERGTWDETSAEDFDRTMALNARAPFLLMQGIAQLMARDGHGGSIVNIGSVHAHGGTPKLVANAASKSALLALTRNFAFAMRRQRIRANYIALGWTDTPTEHQAMLSDGAPSDWLEKADAGHPFGRILRPDDVARLVVHLMSDDAALQTAACIDLHEKFLGTWE